MGAQTFKGLIAWQLGNALREAIGELLNGPRLATSYDLRDQLDRASDSVCSNIAEGFRRRSHRQFAHFLDVASGSLGEIEDRLTGAVTKKRLDQATVAEALNLTKRTSVAVCRLRNYLLRTPTPTFGEAADARRTRTPRSRARRT